MEWKIINISDNLVYLVNIMHLLLHFLVHSYAMLPYQYDATYIIMYFVIVK